MALVNARLEGPVIPRQSPETRHKPYFPPCGVGGSEKVVPSPLPAPNRLPSPSLLSAAALLSLPLRCVYCWPTPLGPVPHLSPCHMQPLVLNQCPKHSTQKLSPSVSISLLYQSYPAKPTISALRPCKRLPVSDFIARESSHKINPVSSTTAYVEKGMWFYPSYLPLKHIRP